MELDETDRKILNVLVNNSRLAFRQIAKKIGVSAATVMHHINKLEKEKIIEKYYIEVGASAKKRFLIGFAGGIGWGIGLTLGTAAIIYIAGIFVSKVDFVPVFGKFAADVINSAQSNLITR